MYYRIILQIFLQLNKALDGVASLEICADPTFAWSFIFCLLEGPAVARWLGSDRSAPASLSQSLRLRLLSFFFSLFSSSSLSLHAVLLPSPFPDLSPRRRTTLNSFPLPHRRRRRRRPRPRASWPRTAHRWPLRPLAASLSLSLSALTGCNSLAKIHCPYGGICCLCGRIRPPPPYICRKPNAKSRAVGVPACLRLGFLAVTSLGLARSTLF